jgi:hypothetical protein
LTIVYDHSQPATGLDVPAIEPLAVRDGVQGPVVRASNGTQDDVDVVEQPGTPLPRCSLEPTSNTTSRPSGSLVRGCSKDTEKDGTANCGWLR